MSRSCKRQFQPSINSYFSRISTDAEKSPETNAGDQAPSNLSPLLPTNVQASLLNVGMRVRKSVPEGYQTKIKRPISYHSTLPYGSPSTDSNQAVLQAVNPTPSHTGLMPYCGILKIGGLAEQPVPAEEDLPLLHFDDDWSLPCSSQESCTSSAVPAANMTPVAASSFENKKRRREDAGHEDLRLESQSQSLRSRPISHTRMPNLDQIRPMALPKSRRKFFVVEDTRGGMYESEMTGVGDFGESPFFRSEEWREESELSDSV